MALAQQELVIEILHYAVCSYGTILASSQLLGSEPGSPSKVLSVVIVSVLLFALRKSFCESPGWPDPPIVMMVEFPIIIPGLPADLNIVQQNRPSSREIRGARVGIEADIMPTAVSTTVQTLALLIPAGSFC